MEQWGPPRIEWEENGRAEAASVEEVDRLLDDLAEQARERPFIVELMSSAGDSLAIGLGREESILSWVQASGDPPYYASKGDRDSQGLVVFFYGGRWSEFPRSFAVGIAAARKAMRLFFETGQRPTNVEWDEV
ncbi:MAG TPA: Imm1 family immunity protein [Candidatus Dormibacteraeota bacterium]|nr:Imm1 family immunity protein [Candidatus Dormibacteraeota bacterium]